MDLKQKLEYQQGVEHFLEDNHVYDLFESLLKELVLDQPEDPLNYLIKKLELPQKRRLFIVGATGTQVKGVGKELASRFRLEFVSTGEVLKAEVDKKTPLGLEIEAAWKAGLQVQDETVLQVLTPVLETIENTGKSYLLEGCPLTRVQGLALQRAGLIPDRLAILSHSSPDFLTTFIDQFTTANSEGLSGEARMQLRESAQTQQLAANSLTEYEYNLKGVKEVYGAQWHEVDGVGNVDQVSAKVERVFKVKGRSRAPRKPPRVMVLGPPGSGRSSQARKLSQRYGLVLVSSSQLLKDQIQRKTDIGRRLAALIQEGSLVPSDIVTELVRSRLEQTDCKVNGWVLDAAPKTIEQAHAFKSFHIIPTHVFFLEAPDAMVFDRVSQRRLDPITGTYYDGLNPPPNDEVRNRLIQLPEDAHEAVKKRLTNYKGSATRLHAEYGRVATNFKADLDSNVLTEMMGDVIENSVPHEIL
jgi:adenylate kinase